MPTLPPARRVSPGPRSNAPPTRYPSAFPWKASARAARRTLHALVLEVALACAPGTDVAMAQRAERSLAAALAVALPEPTAA